MFTWSAVSVDDWQALFYSKGSQTGVQKALKSLSWIEFKGLYDLGQFKKYILYSLKST